MTNQQIIQELQRIINGIEGDTFTADRLQALINKLRIN